MASEKEPMRHLRDRDEIDFTLMVHDADEGEDLAKTELERLLGNTDGWLYWLAFDISGYDGMWNMRVIAQRDTSGDKVYP